MLFWQGDKGDRGSRGQPGSVGPVGPMGAKVHKYILYDKCQTVLLNFDPKMSHLVALSSFCVMFSPPGGTRNYGATRKTWTVRKGYARCQGKRMLHFHYWLCQQHRSCFNLLLCQGEPGPQGAPGAVGEPGLGLSGPKVSPDQGSFSPDFP